MNRALGSIAAWLLLAAASRGSEMNLLANGGFEMTGRLGPKWLDAQTKAGITFDGADPVLPVRWVIRSAPFTRV